MYYTPPFGLLSASAPTIRSRVRELIAQSGTADIVIFETGGAVCALARQDVRAILPVPNLWRPPELPAPVEGFFNLGGSAVPVLALARLFRLPATDAPETIYRHLVLPRVQGSSQVAFLVDRVRDITAAPSDGFLAVDETRTLNGCVEFEISIDGALVHVLSVERILMAKERDTLDALYGMAQSRLSEWSAVTP